MTDELELKLRVPPAVLPALHDELKALGATVLPLRALYFDTADHRLARAQVALRLRLEGEQWVQTLKAPGDSAVHRLEHEVALPDPASQTPVPDPQRHAGHPAQATLLRALGPAAVELQAVLATEVTRLRAEQRVHGTTIELALDTGEVRAGERSAPLAELELELKDGPAAPLFDLAAGWSRRHGLWLSTLPKAARGQRLRSGAPVQPAKAAPLLLPAKAGGADLLRAVLRSTLDQVLANAGEVAEGDTSPEVVHQLRVGLRRLRTALRELAALSPALDAAWAEPLAEAFGRLGERRDDEVVGEAVQPLLQAAGAPLTRWPVAPGPDLGAVVREPALQQAFIGLLALAHAQDDAFAAVQHGKLRRQLARQLQSLWRRVLRDGRRFDELPIEEQHGVRKRLKRLRYLAEFARPLWPAKAVDRCLNRLKPAQEALGEHNDVAVAAERFAQALATDPRAGFAAGWLQAHLAVTARHARKSLRRLDDGQRFWRD